VPVRKKEGSGRKMRKNVLLADDEHAVIQSLEQGLAGYKDVFSIVSAADGEEAIKKLGQEDISLVVTDLRMPKTDGFGVLAHVMECYPDIPVIVMTGYSTTEIERLASQGGAVGYIPKPFKPNTLAELIMAWLRRQAEGGTLHNVSSGMFLQLIEMEQKTCTIRLVDKDSGKKGVLFFRDGELLNARVNSIQGEKAAYKIFSWEEVSLSIQNSCRCRNKKIEGELQAILLEAMRLKDEKGSPLGVPDQKKPVVVAPEVDERAREQEKAAAMVRLKKKLTDKLGPRYQVNEICYDNSRDGLLGQMSRMGRFFSCGALQVVYMGAGASKDVFLLPGEETLTIAVDSQFSRDRMIETLLEEHTESDG
jgi:CheY-like chemotaxis protein